MKSKDAIRLFLKKEYSELRGRRNFNLWVLTGVFCVSILVIGFGSASMSYLGYKMDDPFINWIDINLRQSVEPGKEDPQLYLKKKEVQEHFQFVDPQLNYVHYNDFWKKDQSKAIYFDGRSIAAYGLDNNGNKGPNPILDKILDDNNVVEKRSVPINDEGLGVIITAEMAHKLGYEEMPAFVAINWPQDTIRSESVGLKGGDNPVFLPVMAVVKQLPSMKDFLFTKRYWSEINSIDDHFCLWLNENNEELLLCGDIEYLNTLKRKAENEGFETEIVPYYDSWKEMSCLKIRESGFGEERTRDYNELMEAMKPDMNKCTRIYSFRHVSTEGEERHFYSVRMLSLDSIRAFAEDIHEKCGIRLEMTGIDAKENFNFVQRMGMVLSSSIIVIVALFILVFIYFMLQSHFQKIQRNLGTFKAFGVGNSTLDMIYVRLILRIVCIAFIIGAMIAAVIAWVWSLFSVIETDYKWVDVFVWWNLLLLVLAIVSAVIATMLVSGRMLKKTPGDLIYDRV